MTQSTSPICRRRGPDRHRGARRDLLGTAVGRKGHIVLVPRLGTQHSVEIGLPGRFNVTPRLAQAVKLLPGVEQVEKL